MKKYEATSTLDLDRLMNVRVCRGGLRIHTANKVASSALRVAIAEFTSCKANPDDSHDDTTMMVVRHPLDRMVSMFTYFLHHENHRTYRFAPNIIQLGYMWHMTFDEFLDVYRKQYMNDLHTLPQVYFKGKRDIDILIPIEKLSDVWENEIRPKWKFFKEMQHTNDTNKWRKPWEEYFTTETRQEFETLLADDLELYNHART